MVDAPARSSGSTAQPTLKIRENITEVKLVELLHGLLAGFDTPALAHDEPIKILVENLEPIENLPLSVKRFYLNHLLPDQFEIWEKDGFANIGLREVRKINKSIADWIIRQKQKGLAEAYQDNADARKEADEALQAIRNQELSATLIASDLRTQIQTLLNIAIKFLPVDTPGNQKPKVDKKIPYQLEATLTQDPIEAWNGDLGKFFDHFKEVTDKIDVSSGTQQIVTAVVLPNYSRVAIDLNTLRLFFNTWLQTLGIKYGPKSADFLSLPQFTQGEHFTAEDRSVIELIHGSVRSAISKFLAEQKQESQKPRLGRRGDEEGEETPQEAAATGTTPSQTPTIPLPVVPQQLSAEQAQQQLENAQFYNKNAALSYRVATVRLNNVLLRNFFDSLGMEGQDLQLIYDLDPVAYRQVQAEFANNLQAVLANLSPDQIAALNTPGGVSYIMTKIYGPFMQNLAKDKTLGAQLIKLKNEHSKALGKTQPGTTEPLVVNSIEQFPATPSENISSASDKEVLDKNEVVKLQRLAQIHGLDPFGAVSTLPEHKLQWMGMTLWESMRQNGFSDAELASLSKDQISRLLGFSIPGLTNEEWRGFVFKTRVLLNQGTTRDSALDKLLQLSPTQIDEFNKQTADEQQKFFDEIKAPLLTESEFQEKLTHVQIAQQTLLENLPEGTTPRDVTRVIQQNGNFSAASTTQASEEAEKDKRILSALQEQVELEEEQRLAALAEFEKNREKYFALLAEQERLQKIALEQALREQQTAQEAAAEEQQAAEEAVEYQEVQQPEEVTEGAGETQEQTEEATSQPQAQPTQQQPQQSEQGAPSTPPQQPEAPQAPAAPAQPGQTAPAGQSKTLLGRLRDRFTAPFKKKTPVGQAADKAKEQTVKAAGQGLASAAAAIPYVGTALAGGIKLLTDKNTRKYALAGLGGIGAGGLWLIQQLLSSVPAFIGGAIGGVLGGVGGFLLGFNPLGIAAGITAGTAAGSVLGPAIVSLFGGGGGGVTGAEAAFAPLAPSAPAAPLLPAATTTTTGITSGTAGTTTATATPLNIANAGGVFSRILASSQSMTIVTTAVVTGVVTVTSYNGLIQSFVPALETVGLGTQSKYVTIEKTPLEGRKFDTPQDITYRVVIKANKGYAIQLKSFTDTFTVSTSKEKRASTEPVPATPKSPLNFDQIPEKNIPVGGEVVVGEYKTPFDQTYHDTGVKNTVKISFTATKEGEQASSAADDTAVQSALVCFGECPQKDEGGWPMSGVLKQGPFGKMFGKINGSESHATFHSDAIDIAPRGPDAATRKIYAAYGGEAYFFGAGVRGISTDLGYHVVIVNKEENYVLVYAHMSGFAGEHRPGDAKVEITAGEQIGIVGNTGNSSGPHLHYEFRPWSGTGWTPLRSSGETQLERLVPPRVDKTGKPDPEGYVYGGEEVVSKYDTGATN